MLDIETGPNNFNRYRTNSFSESKSAVVMHITITKGNDMETCTGYDGSPLFNLDYIVK